MGKRQRFSVGCSRSRARQRARRTHQAPSPGGGKPGKRVSQPHGRTAGHSRTGTAKLVPSETQRRPGPNRGSILDKIGQQPTGPGRRCHQEERPESQGTLLVASFALVIHVERPCRPSIRADRGVVFWRHTHHRVTNKSIHELLPRRLAARLRGGHDRLAGGRRSWLTAARGHTRLSLGAIRPLDWRRPLQGSAFRRRPPLIGRRISLGILHARLDGRGRNVGSLFRFATHHIPRTTRHHDGCDRQADVESAVAAVATALAFTRFFRAHLLRSFPAAGAARSGSAS